MQVGSSSRAPISSARRGSHAHPGTMSKQICSLASQPGRAGAVPPACSPRDSELPLWSCFFLKHSGFAVLAVPGRGQEGSGPAAGATNRQRDQRAKSHVVHFTKDIHKPVKTRPVKDQQLFSSAALPCPAPRNTLVEHPQAALQRRGFTSRSLGSLWPIPCCKAGSFASHVLTKSQGLGGVEVNRDLACLAGQLHGIPRMVTSSSHSFQRGRGKLAPGHSRMERMFEMAPSGSIL